MTEAWDLTRGQDANVRPLHARKVALVTGGTDGIGRAVALALAHSGHRVVFAGRDRVRARQVLSELNAACPGAEHAFLHADLSLLSETARVCDELLALTPRLDCAVLCAGILSLTPEWTSEGLERSFVLNYLCRFLLAQRLTGLLKAA